VYLDDLVDALMAAYSRSNIEGRLFHLLDPESVTRFKYIDACRGCLGAELKMVRLTKAVFPFIAWGAADLSGRVLRRSVPLTRHWVHSLRPLASFDRSAATRDLGCKPAVGVREGLRRNFACPGH